MNWIATVLALLGMLTTTATVVPTETPTPTPTATPTPTPTPETNQPNIILILTDDQRSDDWAYMPYTQARLDAKGAWLPNMITTTPLCCPSRASILTGEYATKHGIHTNSNMASLFAERDEETFAVKLHEAGYQTGYVGKYLNGYKPSQGIPPGWDRWYGVHVIGTENPHYNWTVNDQGVEKTGVGYMSRETGKKAIQFMRANLDTGTPFFLMWSPYAPHGPVQVEPQYEGLFPEVTDERLRGRRQMIQTVDDIVRQITAHLNNYEAWDNTYIFVTSDNGCNCGAHGYGAKNVPHEESVRVGLIARGPGVPVNVTIPEQVANIDLASTFLDIAGLPPLANSDGISFLDLLHGTFEGLWREVVDIESWELYENDPRAFVGWRTNEEKYFQWKVSGEIERYDLVNDPGETTDLERD